MKVLYVFRNGDQVWASHNGSPVNFFDWDDAASAIAGGDARPDGFFWPEGRDEVDLVELRVVR